MNLIKRKKKKKKMKKYSLYTGCRCTLLNYIVPCINDTGNGGNKRQKRGRKGVRESESTCENIRSTEYEQKKIRIHFWNVFNRGPPAFVHRYIIRVFIYNYIALSCCAQEKKATLSFI